MLCVADAMGLIAMTAYVVFQCCALFSVLCYPCELLHTVGVIVERRLLFAPARLELAFNFLRWDLACLPMQSRIIAPQVTL